MLFLSPSTLEFAAARWISQKCKQHHITPVIEVPRYSADGVLTPSSTRFARPSMREPLPAIADSSQHRTLPCPALVPTSPALVLQNAEGFWETLSSVPHGPLLVLCALLGTASCTHTPASPWSWLRSRTNPRFPGKLCKGPLRLSSESPLPSLVPWPSRTVITHFLNCHHHPNAKFLEREHRTSSYSQS